VAFNKIRPKYIYMLSSNIEIHIFGGLWSVLNIQHAFQQSLECKNSKWVCYFELFNTRSGQMENGDKTRTGINKNINYLNNINKIVNMQFNNIIIIIIIIILFTIIIIIILLFDPIQKFNFYNIIVRQCVLLLLLLLLYYWTMRFAYQQLYLDYLYIQLN